MLKLIFTFFIFFGTLFTGSAFAKDYNLTLYYKVNCPYSIKVIKHLNEEGIAIPLREINQDPSYRQALIGMNGSAQLPCLVVDGIPMLESSEIIKWVDDHLL